MKKVNNQKGFTIIELVVVILLLGILTATALPRFMDVTTEAHTAVNQGVQSALQASVAMYRATYVAKGEPASGAVLPTSDYTSQTNINGFPVGTPTTSEVLEDADCVVVYNDLLQAGGRPVVAVTPTADTEPTAAQINAASADFLAFSTGADRICNYVYTGEAVTQLGTARQITYNSGTGVVTLGVTTALE